MPDPLPDISFSSGLVGQDDRLDALFEMWEAAQVVCAELAARPEADLLSFAHEAAYFSVVDVQEGFQEAAKLDSSGWHTGRASLKQVAAHGRLGEDKPTEQAPTVAPPSSDAFRASFHSSAERRAEGDVDDVLDLEARRLSEQAGLEIAARIPQGPEGSGVLRKSPANPGILHKNRYECECGMILMRGDAQTHEAGRKHRKLMNSRGVVPSTQPAYSASAQSQALAEAGHSEADDALQVGPPIGLVYLVRSTASQGHPELPATLDLGIYLAPAFRQQGLGQRILSAVVWRAFEELHAHRVQARVLSGAERHISLALLTKGGFVHEGTRRASFWSPFEQQWRDETTMAMVDTDWVMRPILHGAPNGMWEALLTRHQKYVQIT
ncbi:hypothetical protein HDZ31DRAFT_61330 [Schizophyllum fasciatum]